MLADVVPVGDAVRRPAASQLACDPHPVEVLQQDGVAAALQRLNISGHTYLQARFAERDCRPCPDRARCTSSATRPRSVAVLPRPLHEIQMRNRLDQQTEQWQRRYAIRADIEATLSQNVRAHGLRRSRYRGLARTHVQHALTAMACNLSRLADWYDTTSPARRAPDRDDAGGSDR
ncbi:transposase [Streptomyces canus]|uniref:transposase n=1 Tax=Streptomyces canus TaxID=58343 RepID=UPI0033BE651F